MESNSSTGVSRTPYALRALRSTAFGLPIGLAIAWLRGQSILYTLVYSASIALLCWFFIDCGRRLVGRWTHSTRPDWPRWPWMLGIVIVGSTLGFAGGSLIGDWVSGGHSGDLFGIRNLRDSLSQLMFALIPAVAITYYFYTRSMLAERENALLVAQRQAAESRLRLLEAQLEPHMFFNTLANLHVLIGVDPPRAQAMLDRLIAFLRATLSGSRATQQPLSVEFARLKDYLSLMQIRMEDRLRTHFELPQALASVPVPPLLLQPLVENSIRHGLEPEVQGGVVEVRAERNADVLVLTVRDTGAGMASHGSSGGTGFGLQQIRERLTTLYGVNASLVLEPATDGRGGTLATVRMPLSD